MGVYRFSFKCNAFINTSFCFLFVCNWKLMVVFLGFWILLDAVSSYKRKILH